MADVNLIVSNVKFLPVILIPVTTKEVDGSTIRFRWWRPQPDSSHYHHGIAFINPHSSTLGDCWAWWWMTKPSDWLVWNRSQSACAVVNGDVISAGLTLCRRSCPLLLWLFVRPGSTGWSQSSRLISTIRGLRYDEQWGEDSKVNTTLIADKKYRIWMDRKRYLKNFTLRTVYRSIHKG